MMIVLFVIYVMVAIGVAVGYYELMNPVMNDRKYIIWMAVFFGVIWPAVVAYVWVNRK